MKILAIVMVLALVRPAAAEEQLATQESRIVKMHLETLFERIPGVRVMPAGNAVIIGGEIDSPEDMRHIYDAVAAVNDAGGPIRVFAMNKLTENAKAKIIAAMKKRLGDSQIEVSIENTQLVLEGIAKNDFEADRAVEFAKMQGVESVVDLLRITPKRATASAKRKPGPSRKEPGSPNEKPAD